MPNDELNIQDTQNTESCVQDTPVEVASEASPASCKSKHGRCIGAIKAVGFFLVTVSMLAVMYFGGRPNIPGALHVYRTYQLNRIFSERENSLDVLYVGNSGVYSAVSPMALYEEYGIAGYNCSQSLFMPRESYETTLDILKEQSPKVIALEVDQFFYDVPHYLALSYTKHAILSAFPFYESHLYWRDGFKRSERDYKKNFLIIGERRTGRFKGDRRHTDEVYRMKNVCKKYLIKFNELCKEKGIKLMLFYVPSLRNWSYDHYNFVKAFAQEEGLDFFDMNVDADFEDDGLNKDAVDIDWLHDSRDGGDHLNYYGAVKATRALGEWLKAHCDIPDRRGDPKYKDWESDLVKYKEEVNRAIVEKQKGKNTVCMRTFQNDTRRKAVR